MVTYANRDRWGRPYVVPPNGGKAIPYTRATTISGTCDDRYALEKWLQRNVAIGLGKREDLMLLARTTDPFDKDALNKICEQALEAAGSDRRANLGTAFHALTELIDLGLKPVIPAEFEDHADAYIELTRGWHHEYIESMCLLDDLQIAGTSDRVSRVPGYTNLVIADLKTGTNVEYGMQAISTQLAIYSRAEWFYDHLTDTRNPVPPINQDIALVIHVPMDDPAASAIYDVDINSGWEAVDLAIKVRAWRSRRNIWMAKKQLSDLPERVETRDETVDAQSSIDLGGASLGAIREWVRERVRFIGEHPDARVALQAAWPYFIKSPSVITETQIDVVVKVLDDIERDFELSFPPLDPRVPQPGTKKKENHQ